MTLDIEKQNFTKLFRLTFEGGAFSLRCLLRIEARNANQALQGAYEHDDIRVYIANHNQEMQRLPKTVYDDVLKYVSESVPVEKWEIKHLQHLLIILFASRIRQQNLEADIKYILTERNKLAHTADIAISAKEFGTRWPPLIRHVLNIGSVIEYEERQRINTLIAELTEGNYDAVASVKSLHEIAGLIRTLEELDDRLWEAIKGEWSSHEYENVRKRLQETVNHLGNQELFAKERKDCMLHLLS